MTNFEFCNTVIEIRKSDTNRYSFFANLQVTATGDPVNSWDPTGLTCQDVQQAVVQADNLHIQMDQASINALNRTCTHTMALNNYLIQGNVAVTTDQNHSLGHELWKSTVAVGNDLKGFAQGSASVVDPNVRCTGPMSSCYVGAVTTVTEGLIMSGASIYYGASALLAGEGASLPALAYSAGAEAIDAPNCYFSHDPLTCTAAVFGGVSVLAGAASFIGFGEAAVAGLGTFALNLGLAETVADIVGLIKKAADATCDIAK